MRQFGIQHVLVATSASAVLFAVAVRLNVPSQIILPSLAILATGTAFRFGGWLVSRRIRCDEVLEKHLLAWSCGIAGSAVAMTAAGCGYELPIDAKLLVVVSFCSVVVATVVELPFLIWTGLRKCIR